MIGKVALEAENKGLFEEAVKLYELAKVSTLVHELYPWEAAAAVCFEPFFHLVCI